MVNRDETYIKKTLELAVLGLGKVAPNPMVGCVIVKGNKIVSEGYHKHFGEAHAEVNAIKNLPSDFDFSACTLYVNLEPCSHYGKTPPCADLIVAKKFKKVVIGALDPNPQVAGQGMEKLAQAGIEVSIGVLEKECKDLNKRFYTFHQKKRPYLILKWAQTADGFISRKPLPVNKIENWVSSEESKELSHLWRSQEQAILIGFNTAVADDPELTTRLVQGNNPIRVVLDKNLELDPKLKVFNNLSHTIVFNTIKNEVKEKVEYIKIDFEILVPEILKHLYQRNILSVIIEGGTKTHNLFIEAGLWDEARVLFNPTKLFYSGIKAPVLPLNVIPEKSGVDKLFLLKNN
jgi:diaminohydroxyphosphoribosylaminopyrimidine deaminase/5-amino-6-(5-phosphoribosylamino)uracil reductase